MYDQSLSDGCDEVGLLARWLPIHKCWMPPSRGTQHYTYQDFYIILTGEDVPQSTMYLIADETCAGVIAIEQIRLRPCNDSNVTICGSDIGLRHDIWRRHIWTTPWSGVISCGYIANNDILEINIILQSVLILRDVDDEDQWKFTLTWIKQHATNQYMTTRINFME